MAIPEQENTNLCDGDQEDSRINPARVRVKFVESQPAPHLAPPSPDVILDFGPDIMTSEQEYHRQIIQETGVDNPFRPDGELSREADTIVSLIREGKPLKPEDMDASALLANGTTTDHPDSHHKSNGMETNFTSSKKGSNGAAPGVVEVQHGVIVPPSDAPAVEQVVIKKKDKCNCCIMM